MADCNKCTRKGDCDSAFHPNAVYCNGEPNQYEELSEPERHVKELEALLQNEKSHIETLEQLIEKYQNKLKVARLKETLERYHSKRIESLADDCVHYVKNVLGIKLYPFQEEMLRAFATGKNVRTARGVGRSMVASAYGKYVAHLLDKNNYDCEPDVVFPFPRAVREGLCDQSFLEYMHAVLSPEAFKRDMLCE